MQLFTLSLIVTAMGCIIGSFLNVCIYRIPVGKSIVQPGSHCPACMAPVRWYQNVPVVSYVFLGGRCSSCRLRISPRYPLVEALTGLLFLLVFLRFGVQWATPVYWLFVSTLVAVTFIDLDHQIIPDVISLPGIVLGFLLSFAIPWLPWLDSLLGILLGGGLLLAVAVIYEKLSGKEGMGGGDIKLLAMIGSFLGWQAILPVIFLASLSGSVIGIPLALRAGGNGKTALPFGPFLSLAAAIWLFWGDLLLRSYLSLYK